MSDKCKAKYANVGGQAVIEGIMMKSPKKAVMAVRNPQNEIVFETIASGSVRDKYPVLKWPIIRGCAAFVESLVMGYKTISRSASLAGLEEETGGNKVTEGIVLAISMVLGIVLALGLFLVLPMLIVWLLTDIAGLQLGVFKGLVEGIVRMIVFIFYILLVSKMKDIKRLFMYHGAEHKTIFCFEAREELTVENVRKFGRLHPRCGTAFLFLVFLVGILFSSFITWDNMLIRFLLKLLCLPLVAGISFELIRFTSHCDNWLTKVISAPGKAMQLITTAEPDDAMIEVAIAALKASLTDDNGNYDPDCAYPHD